MSNRALCSMLTFALAGCGIGDNDVVIGGDGDGGGAGGAGGGSETEGDSGDDSDPADSATSGGDASASGGGDDDDDGDAGESGDEGSEGCGDAIVQDWEICDDGNTVDGDGCQADCTPTIGVWGYAVGGAHTCAINYFGTVRCFGDNAYGQLGYGVEGLQNVGASDTAFSVGETVRIGERVASLALGFDHSCALTESGAVYCWGRNDAGQLGYGHTDHLGDERLEVPSTFGAIPLARTAVSIAAGRAHTCVALDDGQVRCWGDGADGQLGIGNGFDGLVGAGVEPYKRVDASPPADLRDALARRIDSGVGDFSCITDQFKRLRCWGANAFGQLGIGTRKTVGVETAAGEFPALLDDRVAQVAVGEAHVCVANENLAVQCFGRGDSGQLGYGSTDHIGDDEPPIDGVVHLGGRGAEQLAAGSDFTCALLDDATVVCWGAGAVGQLGRGETDALGDDEYPAAAATFGPVKMGIAATSVLAGSAHACARTGDARLRCWGSGADGRLGYGSPDNVGDSPERIPIHPVPIFQFP